jgi:hypothetical protein
MPALACQLGAMIYTGNDLEEDPTAGHKCPG